MSNDSENLRFNVYVDAMISGEFDSKTQGEIAQLLGVDPRTIWEWKKKADWPMIQAERRKLYSHQILKIDTAMIKAAEAGDVPAAKIVYERFDGWVPASLVINKDASNAELDDEAKRIENERTAKTKGNLPGDGAEKPV